jgi:2-dehydropantoate 2-reductase
MREYNGQTEERKVYKFPPGFDFVQNFADRTTTENMGNSSRGVSIPPPKKRRAEPWTPEDLELYRKYFDVEDMVMLGSDSTSVPAAPDHIAQKRTTPAYKAWNEKAVKSEALGSAERQPPELSAEDARKDAGEDSDGQFQLEATGKSGTMLDMEDNTNCPVGLTPEPRVPHIEGKPGSSMEDALNDSEEPQLVPYTPIQAKSHRLESNSIDDGKMDVNEEGELSFSIDMDPAAYDHEQDEELERAMQHFNLGMWHKPWRPPRQVSQEEQRESAERDLSKQLELQKEQVVFDQTIHILGMGTAGKYIAHSLAGLPHGPPVTLLMHRPLHMQMWHDEGAAIKILTNGEYHVQEGFHIESASPFQRKDSQQFLGFGPNLEHSAEPPNTVIQTLIVTTDMKTTLSALSSIRHRLRKSTTICLFQDGLGIIEKINESLFPNPHDRPTYVLGRISHDLKSTDRHFTIVENEPGQILFTNLAKAGGVQEDRSMPAVRQMHRGWSPEASILIQHLVRAPELNAKHLEQQIFFISQLEHLVIGAVIGPLSVAFDCSNDQLLRNFNVAQYIRFLLHETVNIIKSFPEFATPQPLVENLFRVDKLEPKIIACLQQSGKNVSQMLRDVRAGRKTDIDFYTGYLVKRAKELGIECPINHMLLYLVKGRQGIKSREKFYLPFADRGLQIGY